MMEEWRDIENWEGLYQVSSEGRVRSLRRPHCLGRVLSPGTQTFGYPNVGLHRLVHGKPERRTLLVHRLVARAFIGPCPAGHMVCHNDGNPANNTVSNLRYDTPAGNQADRLRHGTFLQGAECKQAKLSAEKVAWIKANPEKLTPHAMARKLGVHRTTVCRARDGHTWADHRAYKLLELLDEARGEAGAMHRENAA